MNAGSITELHFYCNNVICIYFYEMRPDLALS